MKFNEIKDEAFQNATGQYIKDCWTGHREGRLSTLSRITNYLFVLNSGALLASLAYVATKGNTTYINLSIWLFSIGTGIITLRAALDYYQCEHFFSSFQKDVDKFYKNEMDWEDLLKQNNQRGQRGKMDWTLHILGWLSAILFFGGLFNGIYFIS